MTVPETTSTQGQAPTTEPAPQGQGQAPTSQQGSNPSQQTTQPGTDGTGGQDQASWVDSLPPEAQAEIRRLRAEAASRRTELQSERARREELERAQMTDQQRLEHERETLKRERDEAVGQLLRYEVATAKGIPASLVGRLQGQTREELEQDADKLKADFGLNGQAPTPNFDAGARPPAPNGEIDMNSLIRRAAGRPA